MSSSKKKKALLVALSMVMIYFLWRQVLPVVTGFSSGSGALTMARRSSQDGDRAALSLPEVVDLRLDDLEKETEQFSAERDPFRFGPVKKPSPPPPTGDSESAMRRALREAKEREQREAAPPRPPERQPPQIDVSFLGSFGPQGRRLAVFSDGTEIFNVFEGDQLNEKFYVVKIGLESVDIGFVDFPDAPAQRLEVGG
jgi:hypothetical protein